MRRALPVLLLCACGRDEAPDNVDSDAVTPVETDDGVGDRDSDPGEMDAEDTDPVSTDIPPDTDAADTNPAGDTDTDVVVVPLPGFGVVSGACGVLDDAQWTSSDAFRFRSALDFGAAPFDPALLSAGAQEILAEGTLGGSSGESEALAFDWLYRCERAELVSSESEIRYLDAAGKKTDALVALDGRSVGVSVTRALTWRSGDPCSAPEVPRLTTQVADKVADLQRSETNAHPDNAWERSLLVVVACDAAHAGVVEAAFDALAPPQRGDAIVVVVVTDGDDGFLY